MIETFDFIVGIFFTLLIFYLIIKRIVELFAFTISLDTKDFRRKVRKVRTSKSKKVNVFLIPNKTGYYFIPSKKNINYFNRAERSSDKINLYLPKNKKHIDSSFYHELFFKSFFRLGEDKFMEKVNIISEFDHSEFDQGIIKIKKEISEVYGEEGIA